MAKKNKFWTWFWPIWPKFGLPFYLFFFFSKIWLRHSLDVMVSYHHVQYQKKLMIRSWENLVTDRRTDRRTDKSDFIGRCPTNVERPKTVGLQKQPLALLPKNVCKISAKPHMFFKINRKSLKSFHKLTFIVSQFLVVTKIFFSREIKLFLRHKNTKSENKWTLF